MNILLVKKWSVLLCFFALLIRVPYASADEKSFGYRVFGIQQKLALKGSLLAQYKLGTFYEFGISVKPNTPKAIVWYKKAAKKNYAPANNRLMYLSIKQGGYNKSKHSTWFKQIIKEAKAGRVHSIVILGQLYHHGLGVKKDLKKAVYLLHKASSKGLTEVDFEADEINKILYKSKAIHIKKKSKHSKKNISPIKAKDSVNKAVKAEHNNAANVESKARPETIINKKSLTKTKSSIRSRYQKALQQQYYESLLLEQQQKWSEGEDGAWSDEGDE